MLCFLIFLCCSNFLLYFVNLLLLIQIRRWSSLNSCAFNATLFVLGIFNRRLHTKLTHCLDPELLLFFQAELCVSYLVELLLDFDVISIFMLIFAFYCFAIALVCDLYALVFVNMRAICIQVKNQMPLSLHFLAFPLFKSALASTFWFFNLIGS